MDKRYDEELLLGYIEGDLSPEDQRLIDQQAAEDPRLRHLLQAMRDDRQTLRNLPEPEPPGWLLDEVDRTLERSMLLGEGEAERQAVEQRQRTVLHRIMWTSSIAALFLVAVTVVVVSVTRLGSESLDYQPEVAADGEPAGDDLVAMNTPRDVDEALAERRRDLSTETLDQAGTDTAAPVAEDRGDAEDDVDAFGAGQPSLATNQPPDAQGFVMSKGGPAPAARVAPRTGPEDEASPSTTTVVQGKQGPQPPSALADSTQAEPDPFDQPLIASNALPVAAQIESTAESTKPLPAPQPPSALAEMPQPDQSAGFEPPTFMYNAESVASALESTMDEQVDDQDATATRTTESLAEVQVVVQTRDMGRSLAQLSEVARRNRADLRQASDTASLERSGMIGPEQQAAPPPREADTTLDARVMAKAGPRPAADIDHEASRAARSTQRLEVSVPAEQASQVIAELQGPMADGYQRIAVEPLARGPITQRQLRQADAALQQHQRAETGRDQALVPAAQVAADTSRPPTDPTWPDLEPNYGAILFEQLPLPAEARPQPERRVVIPVMVELDDLPPGPPAADPIDESPTP